MQLTISIPPRFKCACGCRPCACRVIGFVCEFIKQLSQITEEQKLRQEIIGMGYTPRVSILNDLIQ